MENMNQLKDLLKHEVDDLYSAEEQIIEALPKMIEKANNKGLKNALAKHLEVTGQQKDRLDQVRGLLNEGEEASSDEGGFLSGLFGNGKTKCRGMEGLISEGEKIMKEDMSPEVLDAAIIASAQKIEHYEICGYGTVRAYAQELNLGKVERLLKETLDEEYEADDLLTELAESRLNEKAKGNRKGESEAATRSSSSERTTRARSASRAVPASAEKSTRGRSESGKSGRSSSGSSNGKSRSGGSSSGRSSSGSASGRTSRNGGGAPARKTSGGRTKSSSSGRGRSSGRSSSR